MTYSTRMESETATGYDVARRMSIYRNSARVPDPARSQTQSEKPAPARTSSEPSPRPPPPFFRYLILQLRLLPQCGIALYFTPL